MALARRACPTAKIVLLVDDISLSQISREQRRVVDEADRLLCVATGLDHQYARSRFMKTKVRSLVDGPLIYVDSDALVVKDIGSVGECGADVAAAEDRVRNEKKIECPRWVEPYYKRFGWKYPVTHYCNSGIVYWADSESARQAAELWHERWMTAYRQAGLKQDQPSLNSVLNEQKISFHKLSPMYNAMVEADPRLCRNAAVYHFFASGNSPSYKNTLLYRLVEHLQKQNEINWNMVDQAVNASDPWEHPTDWVKCELATGHYWNAAKLIMSRLLDGSYLKSYPRPENP